MKKSILQRLLNILLVAVASPKTRRFELLAVFIIIAVLRIAGIIYVFPHTIIDPDSSEYHHLARNLLKNGAYGFASNWRDDPILRQHAKELSFLYDSVGSLRPPGFPLLLAGIKENFGESQLALDVVLSLLEALSAVMLFMIARLAISVPVARMTAILYCFNPGSIQSVSWGCRESLITLMFLSGIYFLIKARDGAYRFAVAAGFLLGLGGYVKESVTLTAFIGAAWLAFQGIQDKHLFRQAMLIVLCAVAVWTPWIARNSLAYHQWTGMSTNSGLAFWHGIVDREWPYDARGQSDYTQGIPSSDKNHLNPYAAADARDADNRLMTLVKIAVLKEPGIILKSMTRNIGLFWCPFSKVFMEYGPGKRPQEILTGPFYILFFALAIVGIWKYRKSSITQLVILILIVMTFAHSITFAAARFRMPFDTLLMIYAAGEICAFIVPRKQLCSAHASIPADAIASESNL
jgi:hypothetical protein